MLVELPTTGVTIPDSSEANKLSVVVGLWEHRLPHHLLEHLRVTSALQATSCPELCSLHVGHHRGEPKMVWQAEQGGLGRRVRGQERGVKFS